MSDTKADHILVQHDELRRKTATLKQILDARESWEALQAELSRLYDLINEHFLLEEQGGYLLGVRTANPETEPEIAQLEAAHAQLEATLRELRTDATAGEDWEGFGEAFQKWLSELVDHEAAEHRLLQPRH